MIAPDKDNMRGIVIGDGGYRYFTGAWICIRLLRHLGCQLAVEVWCLPHEVDDKIRRLTDELEVDLKIAQIPVQMSSVQLPVGARAQWALKPWALLQTRFRHVLYLDADSYPIRDSEYLFDTSAYLRCHGILDRSLY